MRKLFRVLIFPVNFALVILTVLSIKLKYKSMGKRVPTTTEILEYLDFKLGYK